MPAHKINQIIASDRRNLENACFACVCRTVIAGTDDGTQHMVADFLWRKIQNGGKFTFRGKAFKGARATPSTAPAACRKEASQTGLSPYKPPAQRII